ncbi:squamous cell carcinoma antigen recognized by T-cells 3-like [Hippocampus comes]|uniref:squamous cell carcinoma antigen recognized by T-cells 3-like n=1 Tax=Hippocampus comes TaxID=109280 RepID=UPI00094EB660|nr:PREDICTED: squamous cell carcinoma antigen recognized by T-cells 3-like [Hippocampus comes]
MESHHSCCPPPAPFFFFFFQIQLLGRHLKILGHCCFVSVNDLLWSSKHHHYNVWENFGHIPFPLLLIDQAPKRHRGNGEQSKEEDILTLEIDLHEKAPPGYKGSARPGFNKAQQASAQQQSDDKTELRNDDSSVFVSNLSYTLDEPEARLRTLFETCGTVKQIRLVSTNKGTFKGYGYVQFESSESVSEALKLDRQQVEGRPMFVSPCVDKNKNPDFKMFKYNTAMEKHKIFISGLPFSCTKEQLEELSKNHGTLKEVRLVTFRSGKPKGLAYVEFADEAQASQAVLKMDGMYVEGNKISVAISNPPRRNTSKPGPSLPTTNPTPHQVHGSRGRGRTQLSLLPRSLNRQSGSASKVENGTASDEGAGDAKPLSNADFAKMLLKK